MSRFENFTPPTLGSELSTSEITILEELTALANSGTGEFIRKSAGSLVNATLSETTAITVANEATDTTCFPLFVTAATGDLGLKTVATLTFNSNTGSLGATTFVGALTGNASGSAATVTEATQTAITTLSNLVTVGTLTSGNSDAIVSAASLTLAGKVELATTAEIDTGTDTTRAIPVDQFVASVRNVRYILFRVIAKATDWDADATTAVGGDLVIPFTGTIVDIEADADTAGTTGTAIVDVNLNGSTIMTTNKLKWDSTEKSTRTYSGTAPGLTTTAVTAGGIITLDIDTNHTTKSRGLTLFLAIRLT